MFALLGMKSPSTKQQAAENTRSDRAGGLSTGGVFSDLWDRVES